MLALQNLQRNVILAPYTTYKIGGPADFFCIANTKEELVRALNEAKNNSISYFVLGTGANILIGDKGFRGLVIHNKSRNFKFDNNLLMSESGVTMADLINSALEKGLSGLEHYVGIPSSIGGAIRQNLHFLSPDRESTVFIESVVKEGVVWEEGKKKIVDKNYFEFGYDDSVLHHSDAIVLEITFELTPKDPSLIQEQISANLAWREDKQPQLEQFPSCGSVFKKIAGIGAGRLIEQAGLKGRQVGGAEVSEKHANYIINIGTASASDVRQLIKSVQKEVEEKTGYKLEPEIGFVGEF